MRLYLLHGCPFAQRVVIALREKKLSFELAFYEPSRRPPALEALGSRAKSPTLFDGEARVFESLAVLEYLEDRHPEPALLPRAPFERARVRMTTIRFTEELLPKLGAFSMEARRAPNDAAKLATLQEEIATELARWNDALSGTHLVSDEVTLADVVAYAHLDGAIRAGFAIPEALPGVRRWVERMQARGTTSVPSPAP